MPTPAEIVVHDGPDDVAEALAARLTSTLADLQARGRTPQVCLTGGGIATKAYARLAQDGPGDVDWAHVALWWGDERFVPAGDDDRNADGTLAVLCGPLRLGEKYVHVMPASDAGLERSDFLVQSTEQLRKFLDRHKERISAIGGLTLIDLDPRDALVSVAVFASALRVTGSGRGGKARDEVLRSAALDDYIGRRARKGRRQHVMPTATRVVAADTA